MAAKASVGDTVNYVRAHASELARLANSAGLDSVAYLLECAALEAERKTKWQAPSGIDIVNRCEAHRRA